jgi:hypothetical protein
MEKFNIRTSIYQNIEQGNTINTSPSVVNGGMPGMPVVGGRLINNRPDGMTGIAHIAEMKKSAKRAEKISMYADAMSLGMNRHMDNMGGDCMGGMY